ncbi:PqqD family protein [Nakamurella sp. GG22]
MLDDRQAGDPRIYRIAAGRAAWRGVGDEGVVLDLDQSVYFGLNRTAGTLWPLLIRGCTKADLVATVLAASPTSEASARADVAEFLATVDAAGLFENAAPA